MLRSYRTVLGAPGAAAFSVAGLVLRTPVAMYPVALVLLLHARTGEYASGGAVTAAYVLGSAAAGPVLSRVADRAGQRRVLLPSALAHVLAITLLVTAVNTADVTPLWLADGVALGATTLPAGALVRARWAFLFPIAPHELSTALSVESTVDELTYVVGPVAAAALATAVDPLAPFVLIGLLVAAGATALHALPATMPPRHVAARPRDPMPVAPVVLITLLGGAIGGSLVGVDVATIAYVGQHHLAPWTGAVTACFAAGSGIAGAGYGARRFESDVFARLRVVAAVFALLPFLLLAAVSVPVLAGELFVVGMATAPMLITVFGALERVVPASRVTEGMAWALTGLSVVAGALAPLVGRVADVHGARVALALPIAGAVLAGVIGVGSASWLRRAARRTG